MAKKDGTQVIAILQAQEDMKLGRRGRMQKLRKR